MVWSRLWWAVLLLCAPSAQALVAPRSPGACAGVAVSAAGRGAAEARELSSLKRGEKVVGFLESSVFEGRQGAKCFVDVGAVRTLEGEARPVAGMLRMPRWRDWRNGTARYRDLGAALRKAKGGRAPVTCYVLAHP